MKKDQVRFSRRLLSGMLSFLLATQPLLPAMAAAITPEGNTQMDKAANGVPVVNIATPNQSGISHNKYNDYNVGKEGLILNNATGQFTQTQLGGIIQNNPNLQPGKEASGIINEVTGANRSQLQGYTEVAGKAANVMVANPYGITCNGCGFINTPNATLTTGKPVLDANGNLQSLDVSKGSITIEGKGLDGSQSDAVSIIARATEINAALHAKDLTVIAGANRVAANGQVSPLNGEGEAPKIAVDTGALGGMYANRIHLVSSEKGLGVNLGNLNARQGDITLNANGKLTIGNSLANGGLSASGEGVTLTGSHKTGSGMVINSTGALALQNANLSSGAGVQLGSDGKVTIEGGGVAAAGELQVAAKQDVAIAATTLVSQKNTSLRSDGSLKITDGSLTSKEKMHVTGTNGLALTRSTLGSDTDVSLNSQGELSAQGGLLSAGNGLTLKAQHIALNNASRADAKGALSLTGSDMNNQGQVNAGGALSLSGGHLVNGGQLAANGSLDVSVSSLNNAGLMQGNSVSVNSGALDNMGTLASGGQLSVQTVALNQQGILSAKNNADIRADATLSNGGKLLSDGTLTVQAATVEQHGVLSGNQGVTVNAENLTAAKDSLIAGQQDIQLNVTQNLNLNGQVNAAGALNVGAKQLTTGKDGHLQSGLDLAITGNNVTLNGVQAAKGSLDVTADRLSHGGKSTGERVGFSAQQSVDNHGDLLADTLALSGTTLTHSGSASAERISIIASDGLASSGSLIADTLALQSQHVVNSGLMQGNTALNLYTDRLENLSGGSLYSKASLALDIPYLANHGLITTDGSLHLNGRQLVNGGEINGVNLQSEYATIKNEAAGRLLADTSLSVHGQQTDNLGLMAADTLALNSQDVNNDGNVLSVGELSLKNQTLHNTGLLQGGTLNLEANTWQNSGNALGETGVTATVHDAFTNQGKVLSQQGMTVHAASVNNSGMLAAKVLALHGDLSNSGILQGDQTLAWDGNRFTNLAGGQVTSGEDLQLSGKHFENDGQLEGRTAAIRLDNLRNSGSVQALDSLKIKANGRLDNQGSLRSLNLFELAAAQLFNDEMIAAKSLSISAPELVNNGIVQGNSALQFTTRNLFNGQQGQLVSGAGLDLGLNALENHGLLLTNTDFTLRGSTLINAGDIQADSLNLTLANSVENQGSMVAKQGASMNTASLDNRGTLAAKSVTLDGKSLRNSGLVQSNDNTSVSANTFITDTAGKWLAGNALLVHSGAMENAGVLQGDTLTFTADSLNNSGVLNGLHGLEGKLSGRLTNSGDIQSGGALTLTADDINSAGRIAGDRLTLAASTLDNTGLWQGTNGLALSGDMLTTGITSRTLSGGALTFDAGNITTQGTLQGQQLTLTADDWLHKGSLISLGNLTADVNHSLTTSGEVMSHGGMSLTAQQLDNSGKLLSESDVTLDGVQLNNSGTVQGNTLTLQQNRIHNQGTLTGLQSLTLEARQHLMARMAMASPQQELINAAGGSLLTQGTLKLSSGEVTNNGVWQGQSVLLNAQTLTNNGAIQSADALQLTLANNLTSAAGSKITALGNATLQALSLANAGQWTAKNLTLKGTTLDNSAAISGVNAFTLAMNGAVRQQKAGSMLSGGALDLTAASVTNEGKIQGATLGMTTGALTNSGRLQGDNGATLSLSGDLINQASGEIVSRQGLTLSTPVLSNYGLMQGGGETHLNATTRALNDGKLLSGAGMKLTTPQYSGAGWLQAANLILNAATATNSGNWLADSATLAGTSFTNLGTAQAGQLAVKYTQLTNNGTLLGTSQLSVNARQINQNAAGKLFSGGGAFGGDQFKGNMPGGMISAAGNSGHVEGTTQAAVADGTITVRDKAGQKQDVANLSRDTEHANDSISPIFDKEKEQNRLKAVGLISDIGGQAADIARTQGEINALKEAKKTYGELKPGATEKEREDWLVKLRNSPEYQGEMKKYGTGSDIQRGIQAATAALQGLAGGNIAGALAGASAPELANIIGHHAGIDDNEGAKAIAHAILGGVTAALQGNSAAAGAAGAVVGDVIAHQLYPNTPTEKLTEEERQTISTLSSIAAGIAGGIAGGNTAGAAAGASAGKNAVENNSLSDVIDATSQGKTPQKVAEERVNAEVERYRKENCAGMSAGACSAKMAEDRDKFFKEAASLGIDFVPVVGDFKSFAEADDWIDYTLAAAGTLPFAKVFTKPLKEAKLLLKAGDLDGANKLIKEASDGIPTKLPSSPTSQSSSGVWKPDQGVEINAGSGKQKDSQIWTETKKTDPVSNAYDHWDKHKSEFPEYQNSKQYVDAAHDFVNTPPKGTLIKERANGDTMYYNPVTNTFAVKNADGTPKTMFKPQNGLEYWEKQK